MKRVVAAVQLVALLAAVAFVVLLFANEPDEGGPAATAGEGTTEVDGAAIFARSCASCHGADGGGGVGPQLSDGHVAEHFPDIDDQIAVITGGEGRMPAFGSRLSEAEIRAVAEFERSL